MDLIGIVPSSLVAVPSLIERLLPIRRAVKATLRSCVVSKRDTNIDKRIVGRYGCIVDGWVVIRGFKTKVAEAVFNGLCPKGFPVQIFSIARRKLEALEAAERIDDLRCRPAIGWKH
jgi:hypothetical protein